MTDKFYTKPEIIPFLLESISDLSSYDCVVEPSAGSGSFSTLLERVHPNVKSYDIAPACASKGIQQLDFLTEDVPINSYKRVIMIGNPPFGRQSSLAVKFFNKAASYDSVQTIAMIFPKSFKKVSIQNRLSLSFNLVKEVELPSCEFLNRTSGDKNAPDLIVPCIFQVWCRGVRREKIKSSILKNKKMEFIKKDVASPTDTLAIRRVGFYAGRCLKFNNQNGQSFLFLRIPDDALRNNIQQYLMSIDWSHDDTVGSRSISKQQYINVLNLFHY